MIRPVSVFQTWQCLVDEKLVRRIQVFKTLSGQYYNICRKAKSKKVIQKKKIQLILFLFLCSLDFAFGQNKVALGIDYSTNKNITQYFVSPNTGYFFLSKNALIHSISFNVLFPFKNKVFLKSGVSYSNMEYFDSCLWRRINVSPFDSKTVRDCSFSYREKYQIISIPLMADFILLSGEKMSFLTSAGTSFSIPINSERQINNLINPNNGDQERFQSLNDLWFNLQLGIGVRYNLSKATFLSLTSAYSISNISNGKPISFVNLSLGFWFYL